MRIIGSAVSRWASPSCGAFPLPFPVYLPSVSPRQTTVLCGLIEVFDDLVDFGGVNLDGTNSVLYSFGVQGLGTPAKRSARSGRPRLTPVRRPLFMSLNVHGHKPYLLCPDHASLPLIDVAGCRSR